jgi:hypothetical protein
MLYIIQHTMQFSYYNDIDLYNYHLTEPIHDEIKDVFMCKLVDDKDKEVRLKSSSMRLLDLVDNDIRLEFVHTANDFYQFIINLDTHLKDEVHKQLTNMLGTLNKETLDNLFKSSINLPVKLPSLPYMMFKLDDTCKFAANRRRKISIDNLKQNNEIEVHLIIQGIYLYKNRYELVYKVYQVKLIGDYHPSLPDLLAKGTELDEKDDDNKADDNI